jgi:hypothetical protein
MKIDHRCPFCDNNSLTFSGFVEWDYALQDFTLDDVDDYCHCEDCEKSFLVREALIEEEE